MVLSLRVRLMLASVLVTFVPAVPGVYLLHRQLTGETEQVMGERLAETAATEIEHIDQWVFEVSREVESLQVRLMESGAAADPGLRLRRETYTFPYLQRICLVGADGVVAASSHAPDVGRALADLYSAPMVAAEV